MESISDNSEVLSITEANLPMGNDGNNDDALMSGFFNDVLQADSAPDGATLANAATVQIAMDGATTSSSETTLVGEETVTATAFGNGLMMGASEENLDSIMDLEVPPSEPSRDLFDTVTEVEPMLGGGLEGSGRLVKVSTLENLVTEEKEEGVIGGDKTVNGEVVKQPPGTVLSDDDEHPLASQLRPVFEMFDPEGKGWIGVDQLQELCRSQGQDVSGLAEKIDPLGQGRLTLAILALLPREAEAVRVGGGLVAVTVAGEAPAQLAPLPPRAELVRVCRALVAVAVLRQTSAVLAFLATAAERIVQAVTTLLQTGTIFALFPSSAERIVQTVTALSQTGTVFAFFSPATK